MAIVNFNFRNLILLACLLKNNSNKFRILVIFCFLFFFNQQGFNQVSISGEVISQSKTSVSYANVLLLSVDSTLIKGAVSNEMGSFTFDNIVEGEYMIAVSMLGFETAHTAPFTVHSIEDYHIGKISVQENETQLQEVVVTARKPLYEQQIDRLIVNVQNSITLAGGNALEVLARSPGIDVNEISNVLSMNGKHGVQIAIDGKISRIPVSSMIDVLRGMDANTIEKIELFSTPPAHFDAEGNAGIINIITKQSKGNGTNGFYSINTGYGRRLKYGATINLNYRKDKLNVYGGYTLLHRFSDRRFSFYRSVNQLGQIVTTDSGNNLKQNFLSQSMRFGLDYDFTKKTVLGFLVSGFINDSESSFSNNSIFNQQDSTFSIVEGVNRETSERTHGLINLNLLHHFRKNENLSFDIDYLFYQSNKPSIYFIDFFDGEKEKLSESEVRINDQSPFENRSIKLDYNKKVNEKIQLLFGIKGTSSQFNNQVDVADKIGDDLIKNETFSQDYELKENIAAAYSSLSFEINETIDIKLGLRYEYTDYLLSTQQDPRFLDRNFGYLFPSLFFSKSLNKNNIIQFSFGRRISRPAFNELAPVVTFIDPNTLFKGNPDLRASISNNVKTDYRFKSVLFSFQYGYAENAIVVYQPVLDPSTNTQIYTTLNMDEVHSASVSLSMPLFLAEWWEIQNKISGNWSETIIRDDNASSRLINKEFSADMMHHFILPNNLSLELAGHYQSSGYYGFLKVQPKGYLNIGLQKKLLHNKGTLRLNISDVFRTNIWRSTTFVPEFNLDNTSKFDTETRIIRLTYSTNFGNSKVKKVRKRSTGSEEERRRIN